MSYFKRKDNSAPKNYFFTCLIIDKVSIKFVLNPQNKQKPKFTIKPHKTTLCRKFISQLMDLHTELDYKQIDGTRTVLQQTALNWTIIGINCGFFTLLDACNIIKTTYNYVNSFWSRLRAGEYTYLNSRELYLKGSLTITFIAYIGWPWRNYTASCNAGIFKAKF